MSDEKDRTPSALCIQAFIACTMCARDRPYGIPMRDWSQLDVGFTRHGLQIWCKRHAVNVAHIDFEGHKHPANLEARDMEARDMEAVLDFGQMIADLRRAASEVNDENDAEGG